jgi:hypothetical protein
MEKINNNIINNRLIPKTKSFNNINNVKLSMTFGTSFKSSLITPELIKHFFESINLIKNKIEDINIYYPLPPFHNRLSSKFNIENDNVLDKFLLYQEETGKPVSILFEDTYSQNNHESLCVFIKRNC